MTNFRFKGDIIMTKQYKAQSIGKETTISHHNLLMERAVK